MPYVIAAYDIRDDRRRYRAANRLLALGFQRVQKSLYIARGGRSLAREAYSALRRSSDPSTDYVMVMVVPRESVDEALSFNPLNARGGRVAIL